MQQNTSRAICDECGGDVVYHTKDDFVLDVYSDNYFKGKRTKICM